MTEFNIIEFFGLIEAEGCICLEEFQVDDESIKWYLSRNGNTKVCISATEETMTIRTTIDLLKKLELGDLIERLSLKA